MTEIGPVEVMVVAFPGSKFDGTVAPALQEVVAKGDIAIVDIAFITKSLDGEVVIVEMDQFTDAVSEMFNALAGELLDLLNGNDLDAIGAELDPGSSAIALVFEHVWARGLSSAVARSQGHVVLNARIPRADVAAALASQAE